MTGANGAGKSTLMRLRLMAGELRADHGTVTVTGRVGHLGQRETPWPPGMTVLQAYAQSRTGEPQEHAAARLSHGLPTLAELDLRVGELSYGQPAASN
ncbi:ATPase subunit of ABC transporter with duplicated ATPase domains [Actinoplanes octamycinicus]|uniref:ATPase subunit of ABC transporter with duplicated ATPase domains n=1 Tax=Actinoplanes octamycinicus TaxID=135948 RepID=A0A7W7H1S3_9ACTN|nr:ATP-binding cassette domain-containing protein [Actinoplanes octamycinicus]MBB4742117.1 ATPase subunit of ABC transporter with duplicated ATPase domains [Actinoplanes octamycinicus]GIE60037.1 hypothetical protein Aoc01nite_54390 [Actinoplanes octamycinicus]